MSGIEIHVGEAREAMAARFAAAWHRGETGDATEEHHLSFDSFETMMRVLTPRRLDLLRSLRRAPAASVAALSRAVKRDYKRVHADVDALTAAGLIERAPDGTALRAPFDTIQTAIIL
jgi:predicted transcriptional regulator